MWITRWRLSRNCWTCWPPKMLCRQGEFAGFHGFGLGAAAGTGIVTEPTAFEPESKTTQRNAFRFSSNFQAVAERTPWLSALPRFLLVVMKTRGIMGEASLRPSDWY